MNAVMHPYEDYFFVKTTGTVRLISLCVFIAIKYHCLLAKEKEKKL